MRTCTFCAEPVQNRAVVCRHCGRDLPTSTAATPAESWATQWKNQWRLRVAQDWRRRLALGAIMAGFLMTFASGQGIAAPPATNALGGIVRLRVQVAQWTDEQPDTELSRLPIPA